MFTKKNKKESKYLKDERFKRIASRRVQEILYKLKLLGNCANKNNYEYSEEQIRKIFTTLENELKITKYKFSGSKNKKEEFKL